MVIGHEITHGFDDKGKQFDEQGNINQWWDTSSSTSFRDKAMCIINQYSQFLVAEAGTALNGLNTQVKISPFFCVHQNLSLALKL